MIATRRARCEGQGTVAVAEAGNERSSDADGLHESWPIKVLVHFTGGPWHGGKGRYVGLDGFPHMHAPGGLYRHAGQHPGGGVVYAFAEA